MPSREILARGWLPLLFAILATGCAVVRPVVPVSENAAVVALVDNAHVEADAGRVAGAVAKLERALRIEPKNPRLWRELAYLRMNQGDYVQAENLAARSNSWAEGDNALRADNWRLIAEARAGRGDEAGAKRALERAKQIER